MSYDIQSKTAAAHSTYQEALARLEAARSTYEQGPKIEYATALEQQHKLTVKIAAYQAEAKSAEEEFKQAFAAAGYERTAAVKQALGRKNDALAMAEELEAALTNVQVHLSRLLLDASPKAESQKNAFESTQQAYATWMVYEAMGESANQLKQALALASPIIAHGRYSLGLPLASVSDAEEARRQGLAFIWQGLLQMASELQKPALPFDVADISPLKNSDILSPVQMHQAKLKLAAMSG